MRTHSICYVDFCGNATETACGEAPDFDRVDRVTIYLSSTTCPGCIEAIQCRLEQVRPVVRTQLERKGG